MKFIIVKRFLFFLNSSQIISSLEQNKGLARRPCQCGQHWPEPWLPQPGQSHLQEWGDWRQKQPPEGNRWKKGMLELGWRKEWICSERPITKCPIVKCWTYARSTRYIRHQRKVTWEQGPIRALASITLQRNLISTTSWGCPEHQFWPISGY